MPLTLSRTRFARPPKEVVSWQSIPRPIDAVSDDATVTEVSQAVISSAKLTICDPPLSPNPRLVSASLSQA